MQLRLLFDENLMTMDVFKNMDEKFVNFGKSMA